jgi:glycosyltransferase involved in cell wall biosynthesis
MKYKIIFWSPCLNKVGTLKSSIYSAISLSRYFNNKFEVSIVNSCGEWNDYLKIFEKEKIEVIDLGYNYFKYLPKEGFFFSRISYALIFITSFFPLIKNLKKNNPDYLVANLITSLPLVIKKIFNFRLKLILSISGHPKMNIFRFLLWKFTENVISLILFPTQDLKKKFTDNFFFEYNKCYYLPNAVINIRDYINQIRNKEKINFDNKFFLAVGRLTRQKNFSYLIDEFYKFSLIDKEYNLIIIGEGEDRIKLQNLINKYKIFDRVYLLGNKNNVYYYMKKAHALVVTSLWEDPGFVLVEAALSNLFIISSDCPNGPKEFLKNGEAGYLFFSNKKNQLFNQLLKFKNNYHSIGKMKILAKKNSVKYSLFRHGCEFNKILSN